MNKGMCINCNYGYNEDWTLKEGLNICPQCKAKYSYLNSELKEIINKKISIKEVYGVLK